MSAGPPIASDDAIRRILSTVRTIAMVGASPNPARPSYGVLEYLLRRGYRVFPINPGQAGKPIFDTTFRATLADVPEPIDMVDVFRASDALPGIVEEMLQLHPVPKVLWTQLGVVHAEAAARASDAGIEVVMDRCPKIEIPRLGVAPR
ncbi:CoA-binding protein [Aureimonas leprariae]|uniref:CoA-binding protein n=1 Tax=Plantimonas leprariae TaxID=2615207 RepID=A0A7V7TWZ2_9HYPH|nr:CoA-binding protein [Aureimonas leprariae]KAB0680731.1 CoA-binding protein [Aureimonas leprariae]